MQWKSFKYRSGWGCSGVWRTCNQTSKTDFWYLKEIYHVPRWPHWSPSAPNGCQICKVCLLFRVGSDVWTLANFTSFDVTFTSALRQNLENVSTESCNRLSNSLTVPLSISQKMLLFLEVVRAPSPDVLKEDKLSSMTTYSVPKISISSISFEMNTKKKLDLLLLWHIFQCVVDGCHDHFHLHLWVQVRPLSH